MTIKAAPDVIHYLPAQPNQVVHVIYASLNNDIRPTIDDMFVEAYAIVAWRITESRDVSGEVIEFVDPVIIEDPPTGASVWHVMPDGRLCQQSYRSVETLEIAKRETLVDTQDEWDRKQRKKAEKAAAAAAKQEPPPKPGEFAQH